MKVTRTTATHGAFTDPAREVPCVLAQFEKLSLPRPFGNVATVVYPIYFKASR